MDETKIKKLASEMTEQLETIKRPNGDKIVALKSGAPEWMKDICRDCHDSMLPDDFRYEFIAEALHAIDDHSDLDDARDSIEPDIYYHEINSWFASRNDRSNYVDQANEELGRPDGVDAELAQGQWMEKIEVFDLLVAALDDLDDDENDVAVA